VLFNGIHGLLDARLRGYDKQEVKVADQFPWKTAWITGASGAICGEIARRLAASGVSVAATARPSTKLDQLTAVSDHIKAFPADVLQPDELKACVVRIESAVGPVDLALLGAGMYAPFDIRNIDLDGFHRSMALNVDGVINAVAAVLSQMLARKSGHIAIMGSLFGYTGWPGNGSYGASKAAVINLAESMRLELEGSGVTVTIINPGFVDTPLSAARGRSWRSSAASLTRSLSRRRSKASSRPCARCRGACHSRSLAGSPRRRGRE
jgi:NADP-dependent 3-hydroxy acid dehydrogenase YdfG